MSDDIRFLPVVDEDPEEFVDSEEFFLEPTPEEIALGNRLGREIDVSDDRDNGLGLIR